MRLPKFTRHYIDKTGRPRFYLRRKGCRQIPLPGLPWSPAFMAAYQDAMSGVTVITSDRIKPGSIDALVHQYLNSATFAALATETQRSRKNILKRFAAEHGDKRVAMLKREHVMAMFNKKAGKRFAARNWLKTVHVLMQFAVNNGSLREDPTIGIKNLSGKTTGYMTWLEPQIAQYRAHHQLGTVARLAIELLLNIAARRHDAHVIGQQHITDGKLCWRPNKTLRTTGKLLKVRMLSELQTALDALPKQARADGVLTLLVSDYGKPFASAAAFGNKFADWCNAAGLKPVLCGDGRTRNYRAHGLRKAALRILAHAGATGVELMSVSGHSSLDQLQEYLNEVDQEHLADAAMMKLSNGRAIKQRT
jgi:integrase